LWQVPGSLQSDVSTMNRTMEKFREAYPDVNIMFVGRNEEPFTFLMEYEDDFISITNKNYDEILAWSLSRIHNSPRFFIYPACDPKNSTMASNYREEGHMYEGFVYPNFTTFLTIHPQNFLYSKELTVKVKGDVRTCFSRTNRFALKDYEVQHQNGHHEDPMDEPLFCIGGSDDPDGDEITIKYMCSSRYVRDCSPLYMSVTGLGLTTSKQSCTTSNNNNDIGCEYVNQIQYDVTHDGMICAASCNLPAVMLLLLPALLQYIFN